MTEPPEKDLRDTIKSELAKLLAGKEEPPFWRLQAIKLSIGFLAVNAKLEEADYGEFFKSTGEPGSVPEREGKKPSTRRAKRVAGPALDDFLDGDGGMDGLPS